MVRIAGIDVPDRKRAHVALRSIYGIGPKLAEEIVIKAELDPIIPPRMNELTEAQVDRIRELVDREYISEGDLRREVNQNIRRLIGLTKRTDEIGYNADRLLVRITRRVTPRGASAADKHRRWRQWFPETARQAQVVH